MRLGESNTECEKRQAAPGGITGGGARTDSRANYVALVGRGPNVSRCANYRCWASRWSGQWRRRGVSGCGVVVASGWRR